MTFVVVVARIIVFYLRILINDGFLRSYTIKCIILCLIDLQTFKIRKTNTIRIKN